MKSKLWNCYRNGKLISTVEAETNTEAIIIAKEIYISDKFGIDGALSESELIEESKFLDAIFTAKKPETITDTIKLRIKELGLTKSFIAGRLEIDNSGFSRRLNGNIPFSKKELGIIYNILKLS
jgi:hypothetical protein